MQLLPEPLAVYDSEHMNEMIDIVARALAKVTPLYVLDSSSGKTREVSAAELAGAVITRAATVLTLKDGHSFSSVSVKRADVRQAIAILKAIGIEELTTRPQAPEPERSEAPNRAAELRTRLTEIEALLRPPLLPGQVEQVNHLLVSGSSLARQACAGRCWSRWEPCRPRLHRAGRRPSVRAMRS